MQLRYKALLGVGAMAVAGAAGSPSEFGLAPTTWQQREALAMCRQTDSSFMAFFASDRENCYSRMRTAAGVHTGLWSRHDRDPRQVVQAIR